MTFPRPSRAQVWRLIWIPVTLATVIWLVCWLTGTAISWWQLWVLGVAATALLVMLSMVRSGDPEPPAPAKPRDSFIADRPFAEVNRWEDRLSWSADDLIRSQHVVQPRLVTIIAERLRLRHGIDLRTQPDRAARALPQPLVRLVSRPMEAPLDADGAADIVRHIEEI